MLTTKRYDYVAFDQIHIHPSIANHRGLNERKVQHYAEDILKNGLLEPLVVWERKSGEHYLVGGFHRLQAIRTIRERHPGYFDRVDVRVVDGELDEMQALNLKLNADRLDAKITDYFDAIIFLNNANWSPARIAEFLDKSPAWIEEIIRYIPGMDHRLRKLLEEGKLSWNRAKTICREMLEAEPGREKETLDQALAQQGNGHPVKPLTLHKAARRLSKQIEKKPRIRYTVTGEDLLSLFYLMQGKNHDATLLDRVRNAFPGLIE